MAAIAARVPGKFVSRAFWTRLPMIWNQKGALVARCEIFFSSRTPLIMQSFSVQRRPFHISKYVPKYSLGTKLKNWQHVFWDAQHSSEHFKCICQDYTQNFYKK